MNKESIGLSSGLARQSLRMQCVEPPNPVLDTGKKYTFFYYKNRCYLKICFIEPDPLSAFVPVAVLISTLITLSDISFFRVVTF